MDYDYSAAKKNDTSVQELEGVEIKMAVVFSRHHTLF
jgi:hypothetical protein